MTDQESTPDGPEWVTLAQAAEKVPVSTRTMRRAIKDGRIVGQRDLDDARSPWLVRLEDVWERWGPPDTPTPTTASGGLVPARMVDDLALQIMEVLEANARLRERIARAEAVMSRRARRRYRTLSDEAAEDESAAEEAGE